MQCRQCQKTLGPTEPLYCKGKQLILYRVLCDEDVMFDRLDLLNASRHTTLEIMMIYQYVTPL